MDDTTTEINMISISGLKKDWPSHRSIFRNFSLDIEKGDFLAILGPNGSGKTTLLNIIAGLDREFSGRLDRKQPFGVGYVFQDYRQSLFPWRTVLENIAYPLVANDLPLRESLERTRLLCSDFGVDLPFGKYPYELSGGQQQLVAALRALIAKPDVLLLDEPFTALDYNTYLFFNQFLQKVWERVGTTIVIVSHDIDEVLLLARRILILKGTPADSFEEFLNLAEYPRGPDLLLGEDLGILRKKLLISMSESRNEYVSKNNE